MNDQRGSFISTNFLERILATETNNNFDFTAACLRSQFLLRLYFFIDTQPPRYRSRETLVHVSATSERFIEY